MFTEENVLESRGMVPGDGFDPDAGMYHVVVNSPGELVLPARCTACGGRDEVLVRRLETKAARPGRRIRGVERHRRLGVVSRD